MPNTSRPSRLRLPASLVLGSILALLAGTWAWLQAPLDSLEAAQSARRRAVLAELQAEDRKKLTTFAWVDRSAGSVQIPIDLAIKLTTEELRANKPRPAYPVASPSP